MLQAAISNAISERFSSCKLFSNILLLRSQRFLSNLGSKYQPRGGREGGWHPKIEFVSQAVLGVKRFYTCFSHWELLIFSFGKLMRSRNFVEHTKIQQLLDNFQKWKSSGRSSFLTMQLISPVRAFSTCADFGISMSLKQTIEQHANV